MSQISGLRGGFELGFKTIGANLLLGNGRNRGGGSHVLHKQAEMPPITLEGVFRQVCSLAYKVVDSITQ